MAASFSCSSSREKSTGSPGRREQTALLQGPGQGGGMSVTPGALGRGGAAAGGGVGAGG